MESPSVGEYGKYQIQFIEFCEEHDRDPFKASATRLKDFLYYLFSKTSSKHGSAKKARTAIAFMWRAEGQEFKTEDYPSVAALLKGYKKHKPSAIRTKRPFSYFHLRKALLLLDHRTYAGTLCAAALSTAYFWGMRIGEYMASNRESWKKILCLKDLEFVYNKQNHLRSIIINFRCHKTNKFGRFNAKVAVDCTCPDPICGVHILWRFLNLRNKEFGATAEEPVFLQIRNNMPMLQTHMRVLVRNVITSMGLKGEDYSPHSLRSGRCSDLKRANKPDWAIKAWGRWRTDCWKKYYLKLDFSDIASLSKLSLNELGFQDSTIQIDNYRTDRNMQEFEITRL